MNVMLLKPKKKISKDKFLSNLLRLLWFIKL
jgi:hypothetical protein